MAKPKSLAKRIADSDGPLPQDYDPEEERRVQDSDEDSEADSGDDLAGTEHYAAVSKSKLRKPEEIALGPEYSGSQISRQALLNDESQDEDEGSNNEDEDGSDLEEVQFADPDDLDVDMDGDDQDIDSDEAFGESDQDKFAKFTFLGSGKPRASKGIKKRPSAADFMSSSDDEGVPLNGHNSDIETDEDVLPVEDQHPESEEEAEEAEEEEKMEALEGGSEEEGLDHSDEDDHGSDDDEDDDHDDDASGDEDDEKVRRAELRKMMSEEQQTVVATISQAAKADADKGNAVKQQRQAFDSLLNVRMVLQKALVATNSMAAIQDKDIGDAPNQPYEAAEEAAVKLWNTLDGIRYQLSKATSSAKTGQKRKRGIATSTSSAEIWERMQNSEISVIDNRQTTLEKWSAKVRGTASLPLSRKLNPTAQQQSITSVLQDQLASSDHLIRKTKMPRSCAPIQRDQKLVEDDNIYDDGNFYQLLLKELVDQRRVESLTGADAGKAMQWASVKAAKTKKIVDTKASKGRKLRYTVHEKLQNFMAPEDRRSWEVLAIDRLFGTLLGQKMTLGEEEAGGSDEEDAIPLEDEGLMLFRS